MKLVSVDKLIPGMVVSENVYTLDDRLVAPKDTILTQKDIDRIRSYSLYNIFVEEEMKLVPKEEERTGADEANMSYSERLRNTQEFILFKQHIEDCAEELEESFRMLANESIPLDVDKLTEPVYHLFVEAGGTSGDYNMVR